MDGTGLRAALATFVGLAGLAGLVGLVACGDAVAGGAEPPPAGPVEVLARLGIKPPVEWVRMPAVEVGAATAAATITSATTAVEAWGDPAAGCYAIAIDCRGKAREPIAASAERLAKGLASLGVDPAAMPKPVKDVLDTELPLQTAELTGAVRIRMFRTADKFPQGIALACAGNAREPARCKTQCEALFAQLAPPVTP